MKPPEDFHPQPSACVRTSDRTPLYTSDRPTRGAEHAPGVQRPPYAVFALCTVHHDHVRVQLRVTARESLWSKAVPTIPRISSWTTPFLPDREVNTHCSA